MAMVSSYSMRSVREQESSSDYPSTETLYQRNTRQLFLCNDELPLSSACRQYESGLALQGRLVGGRRFARRYQTNPRTVHVFRLSYSARRAMLRQRSNYTCFAVWTDIRLAVDAVIRRAQPRQGIYVKSVGNRCVEDPAADQRVNQLHPRAFRFNSR